MLKSIIFFYMITYQTRLLTFFAPQPRLVQDLCPLYVICTIPVNLQDELFTHVSNSVTQQLIFLTSTLLH